MPTAKNRSVFAWWSQDVDRNEIEVQPVQLLEG